MSIAVWTDENGKVVRKHYQPNDVDTSDATDIVDTDSTHPATEYWEVSDEYYSPTDGFHYNVRDATNGLSTEDVAKMKDALNNGNRGKAGKLFKNGLGNR